MQISIHAPARGATKSLLHFGNDIYHFNPRSRKGSDVRSWAQPGRLMLFQSTLPQGERLQNIEAILAELDFNPRSRKGSD